MQLHREYRKDWRTDEQFAVAIKEGHEAEAEIMSRFSRVIERMTGLKPVVEDVTDRTGEVFPEDQITTDADYRVNGVLTEVKFCNPLSREFRFKVSQIDSYIRQKAYVLFVNGWQTSDPEFVVLTTQMLESLKRSHQAKPFQKWGNKLCYFLTADEFQWTPLTV